jgi:hypothetical protein
MSVHHDLRNRFVVQKRFDRSVAEYVVDDAGDQELPFLRRDPFLRASQLGLDDVEHPPSKLVRRTLERLQLRTDRGDARAMKLGAQLDEPIDMGVLFGSPEARTKHESVANVVTVDPLLERHA